MAKKNETSFVRRFRNMFWKKLGKTDFEVNCIRRSPLFDEAHYQRNANMMGVPVGDMDPVLHYAAIGDSKGIPTHPLFDTKYYYESYNDIRRSKLTALFHFILHGAKEGRSPHPLIHPKYIMDQLQKGTGNYLLDFLNAEFGAVDPHPMINLRYIIDQLQFDNKGKDPFVEFLFDKSAKINPNKKFCMSAYVDCIRVCEDGNAFLKYASARKLKELDEYTDDRSLEAACRQIREATNIEPSLDFEQMKIEDLEISRLVNLKRDNSRILESLHESIGDMGADHLFLVSSFDDVVAIKFLRAALFKLRLNQQNPTIYIISGGVAGGYCKDNLLGPVCIINLDNLVNSTSRWDFPHVLSLLVQIESIRNLHVIESDVGWDMLEKFGLQISTFTKLHAHVPPIVINEFGRKSGYAWSHLNDCKGYLATITTNCSNLIELLQRDACKDSCDVASKPELLLSDSYC